MFKIRLDSDNFVTEDEIQEKSANEFYTSK